MNKRVLGYEKDLGFDKEFNVQIGKITYYLNQLKEDTLLSKEVRKLIEITEKFKNRMIYGEIC